jgi:hypothetical protein
VVVINSVDLFVQVLGHISVGVVKALNIIGKRAVVGKEKEVHEVFYKIPNIGKVLFDFLMESNVNSRKSDNMTSTAMSNLSMEY